MDKTEAEINNLKKLYDLYQKVNDCIGSWREKTWHEENIDGLRNMEDVIMKFGDNCVRLPRDLKEWKAYRELKDLIDRTKDVLPIIIDLKKPSIKPRHWIRINEITKSNLNYENPEVMTINDIINANLLQY